VHEGSRKAIIAAFFANLGIAVSKFVGFAITGSASLLAEAIHSVADTGNQALLMLGGKRARRTATPEHPFGYGRERYFWSFVVSLVLFSLGGAFAIYEGIEKLRHPHEPEQLGVAVTILVIAILLESWSFRTAVHESNKVRGRTSWWRFIRRSKNPELPVVLLEDFGALIGLFFALVGVTLAAVTDNGRWDAVGSLAIGILLCCIASLLAVEMKGLLIGESATPEMQDRVTAALAGSPEVQRVIHMRTEHIGPDELLVGAKIELSSHLGAAAVAQVINRAEANVRAAVPEARIIYLEPDIHDPGRVPGSPSPHA
jgi:cation diffusion facilitator family transporter